MHVLFLHYHQAQGDHETKALKVNIAHVQFLYPYKEGTKMKKSAVAL